MKLTIILLIIIIIIGILSIIYITIYNNIQKLILKIQEAENIIDETLRKKYDNISKIVKIINSKTDIDKNTFNKFDELKNQNLSNFSLDRELCENCNLAYQITNDYKVLEKNKEISKIKETILEIDEKLEATKSFYNKYTTELNKIIRNFPSNLVAKNHHIKVLNFFDGKNMNDEIIDDFKL